MLLIMSDVLTLSSFVQAAHGLSNYHPLMLEGNKISSRSWKMQDFFKQPKAQNRKVMHLFKQAIYTEYGQKRIDRICKKYNLDLDALEQSGSPLLASHVDQISIGMSEVFAKDLCEDSDSKAKWLTPQQIHAKVERLRAGALTQENERLSFWRLSLVKMFIGEGSFSFDRTKSMLWSKLSGISYQTYLETLSKRMGSLELEEGALLPAPSSQGSTDYFKVHKKIIKDGLVAYALKPVSSFSLLRPLIVFRPTITTLLAEDAPQTWLNDLEVHMGSIGYESAKSQLSAIMADPSFCPEGKKVDVAGYSLGALHAERFVAANWKKIERAYFFNGPSVEVSLAEKFAKEVNAVPVDSEDFSLSLQVFRTRDDLAHLVGEKHIGWGVSHPKVRREVLEVDFVERAAATRFSIISYVARHMHLFLLNRSFPFVAQRHQNEGVDAQLDNTTNGSPGKYWEKIRVTIGSLLLYPMIFIVHKVFFFTHRYFHFSLFRYSAPKYDYSSFFKSKVVSSFISGSESIS